MPRNAVRAGDARGVLRMLFAMLQRRCCQPRKSRPAEAYSEKLVE